MTREEIEFLQKRLLTHEFEHKDLEPISIQNLKDIVAIENIEIDTSKIPTPKLFTFGKDYQFDTKFIDLAIESFKKYECSKDYDLEVLKENPTELIQVLSNYDFSKEPLNPDYVPETKPIRIELDD